MKISFNYLAMDVNESEQEIHIENVADQTINWCLLHSKDLKLEEKLSKVVNEHFKELKSAYKITKNESTKTNAFKVVTKSSTTVYFVQEQIYRLIELCPEIKEMVLQKATRICTKLNPRNVNFIGRSSVLNELEKNLFQNGNHVVIVQGAGGAGKTCLANEFGHRISEKYKKTIVVFLSSDSR